MSLLLALNQHYITLLNIGFPGGTSGKESACQCRRCNRCWFDPWVGKIPWRRAWHPTPVSLPGKFHGLRSLAGYRPWGRKELDMTDWSDLCLDSYQNMWRNLYLIWFHSSLLCILNLFWVFRAWHFQFSSSNMEIKHLSSICSIGNLKSAFGRVDVG